MAKCSCESEMEFLVIFFASRGTQLSKSLRLGYF